MDRLPWPVLKDVSEILIIPENRVTVNLYLAYSFSGDMEMDKTLPTEEAVREALRSVDDPEVGMSIVELGLVYRIDIAPEGVHVELTMTSPACPMGDLITDNARRAVGAVVGEGVGVDIELVWEPPWTPDLMSESAKQSFGWAS